MPHAGNMSGGDFERAALLRKLLSLEQAELEQTRREIAELRRAFPQLLSAPPKKGHHRRQCEMTRISEIVRNGKSATAVDARVYDQLIRQSNPPHWRPESVVSAVPHKMLLGGQFRKIVNKMPRTPRRFREQQGPCASIPGERANEVKPW